MDKTNTEDGGVVEAEEGGAINVFCCLCFVNTCLCT